MIDPFEGTDTHAHLRYSEDKIRKELLEFSEMGYAVKAHAIGDRSIRIMLNIFDELEKRTGGAMNSIAHGTFIDPADINRFTGFKYGIRSFSSIVVSKQWCSNY